jgi:hypothetical protein
MPKPLKPIQSIQPREIARRFDCPRGAYAGSARAGFIMPPSILMLFMLGLNRIPTLFANKSSYRQVAETLFQALRHVSSHTRSGHGDHEPASLRPEIGLVGAPFLARLSELAASVDEKPKILSLATTHSAHP